MSSNRKNIIHAILTNPKLTEEEKSILVEEFIEEIKREYPDLKYHATKQDITETELRLTKEIENTRKEIKDIEAKLTKDIKELELKFTSEIENTRKEIKDIEAKLTKDIKELELKLTSEIENTRKEIKELDTKFTKELKEVELKLTKEIKETKTSMIKWSFLFWISQMSAMIAIGFFILKALKV